MKLIEVIADSGHFDTLSGLAEQHNLLAHWHTQTDDGTRTSFRILVDDETRQSSAWVVIFWTISLLILFYAVYIRHGFSS